VEKNRRTVLDRPIVLATRNEGKIREFRRILADFPIEIKSLGKMVRLSKITRS